MGDGKTKCFPRFPHFEKFASKEPIEHDDFILKMNKKLFHAKMTHAATKQQSEALAQKETLSTEHGRIVDEEPSQVIAPPDGGRKIVFDNLDLHIDLHKKIKVKIFTGFLLCVLRIEFQEIIYLLLFQTQTVY